MPNLAWQNLRHDKVRFAVTLTGIVFALVLVVVQFGLFLGFRDTTANIVEHSGADLWLAKPGVPHVNAGSVLPESRVWKALQVPGVQRASRMILFFTVWKTPSGSEESVQILGFEPGSGMAEPWTVTEGSINELNNQDTVMIDELYKERLGVTHLGQTVEIRGYRARVVGFTRGIRSFTTSPYIYANYKNAFNYSGFRDDMVNFVLIKAQPGADLTQLKQRLAATVPNVEVFTNAEMGDLTRNYWIFSTGAGTTTLMGAVLGLLVGIVVVAQTIYSATVDHIREFGTLKAMGASNFYVYRVIIQQAVISAVFGYAIALGIGLLIARASEDGNTAILLPPQLIVGLLALAIGMCVLASMLSIRKATNIDPAMVFKG